MIFPSYGLLSSTFGIGVKTRNALYDRAILHPKKLRGPVVSVGNLSMGGAGKTPFVILLGELLKARNIRFDVLSRGYGRRTHGVLDVDPAGAAAQFGDEPLLIARKLGVPVIVGEDRYQAGRAAEAKFGPQLHILDDGFQHRALARDFDIVLVTPEDARDRLLPAGRLREPLSSLGRAHAIVLTGGASEQSFPVADRLVWRVLRSMEPREVSPRPVAFCGIARPQNFFAQLRTGGIEPVAEAVYRDHHAYSARDVQELLDLKNKSDAGGFVTTEKDLINLGPMQAELAPLTAVPVKMKLVDEATAVDVLLRVIEQRRA